MAPPAEPFKMESDIQLLQSTSNSNKYGLNFSFDMWSAMSDVIPQLVTVNY